MQAVSLDFQKCPYNADMNTGRPAKTQRTSFGSRLHQARENKGLSQQQVADELGIPVKTYANWERRSVGIKPEHLNSIASILSVSLDWLFDAPTSSPKKQEGPTGKLRRLVDEVRELPRYQQQRVIATLEDALLAQRAKKAS